MMDFESVIELLCDKIEGRNNMTWEEIVDYCDLEISPITLRKAFNTEYGGYNMLRYARDKYSEGIDDNKIDSKIETLKEERRKLQVVNREYNEILKAKADNELFEELIVDAIKNLKPIEKPKAVKYNTSTNSTGCLFIGDSHYGKEFKLMGLFGEVINEYSPEIYKARMWNLLDQLANDAEYIKYDTLHIFDCGDCIDGILRTGTSLRKLKVGVIDSVLEYSEFMAHWLVAVQDRLNVKVVYHLTGGNHDMLRLLGQKKDFDDENVAKAIHKYIDLRIQLSAIDDIVVMPYDSALYENIYGVNILCYHGDGKNMVEDINFFENYYKIDIDLLAGAHLHHKYFEGIGVAEFGDRDVMRIPSICGTDDFSKKCRKHSRAGARFMRITENAGIDWEKSIWLN